MPRRLKGDMQTMVDERAALPQAEGVLLWSMRTWVLGLCRDLEVAPRIRSAFAGLDAPEAADGLGGFMQALEHGNARTIAVDTMCTPRVSSDERVLLDVFAHVQAGRAAEAAFGLRGMIRPAAMDDVLDGAGEVAAVLADAGHRLGGAPTAPRVSALH